jgi:hypothetical protein
MPLDLSDDSDSDDDALLNYTPFSPSQKSTQTPPQAPAGSAASSCPSEAEMDEERLRKLKSQASRFTLPAGVREAGELKWARFGKVYMPVRLCEKDEGEFGSEGRWELQRWEKP